jgi:probable biosynthetic protein (TIGR04098 family)
MEKYLQIIQQVVPTITKGDLAIRPRDAGIDSLDLVVIRVTLEKHFGFEISDIDWFRFNTLKEALDYFISHNKGKESTKAEKKSISISKQVEITMPQMANSTLSENWLLKELGDLHWKLLSDGIEQNSSEFKDEIGNRLYATFIRICYSVSNLKSFRENERIDFIGEVKRFGNSTYLSQINGESGMNIIKAILMTTFSVRSTDDNSKIEKSKPAERVNHIEEIMSLPDFLSNYRLLRKNLINEWKLSDFTFPVFKESIFETEYSINPYYEINGVGLLYFAGFPIISDFCTRNFYEKKFGNNDWIKKFHTTHRDINYFANCNADDKIIFQLNNFEETDTSIKTVTTLNRQSDKAMLAKIFTVKQRLD